MAKKNTTPGLRAAAREMIRALNDAYPTAFRDYDACRDASPAGHEERRDRMASVLVGASAALQAALDRESSSRKARRRSSVTPPRSRVQSGAARPRDAAARP